MSDFNANAQDQKKAENIGRQYISPEDNGIGQLRISWVSAVNRRRGRLKE